MIRSRDYVISFSFCENIFIYSENDIYYWLGEIMEISLLLIKQIMQMFIMVIFGYLVVKGKILKTQDSKVISALMLYVIIPCSLINAFSIEATPDKLQELLYSFIAAIIVHIVFLIMTEIIGKIFGLMPIEKASIIYTNAGNMVIPLVSGIFGNEWVLYTSGYMVVQQILIWTHGKSLVCNDKNMDIKKIFTNVSIIAILIGLCIFIFKIQLPYVLSSTLNSVGSMVGPLAMIVIGMILANMNFKDIFKEKRTYLVCFFRLIVYPLVMVIIFKLTGLTTITPDNHTIILISLLATSTPPASTITQFAQMYDKHPGYASVMNIMGVMFSIITMPIIVMIYSLL